MKKLYTLVLMSFCFSIFGQGQPLRGNLTKIKLTGMVVDQETKQPLEYATISLKNPKTPVDYKEELQKQRENSI